MTEILDDKLLTPQEVADLFRVTDRTVRRWAITGRLDGIKMPSGRWRFRESAVTTVMDGTPL